MKNKEKQDYVELQEIIEDENDDVQITKESNNPRNRTEEKVVKAKTMTLEEMSRKIRNREHPMINDWYKRPYKTILIVLLLFCASILFICVSYNMYMEGKTYDHWLPYLVLGCLLFIPGAYYTVTLLMIWLGVEGYDYEVLPNLNEDS